MTNYPEFLYWFLDYPDKPKTDIEWAIERFKRKFKKSPEKLLVPPSKEEYYQEFNFGIPIVPRKSIGINYIGLE